MQFAQLMKINLLLILAKNALIMEVDGSLKDLSHEITQDAKVRIITPKDK